MTARAGAAALLERSALFAFYMPVCGSHRGHLRQAGEGERKRVEERNRDGVTESERATEEDYEGLKRESHVSL